MDSLPSIILSQHFQCVPMSMLPAFVNVISRCGDINFNYMTTSTILHNLLSQTVNTQLNGISFNPDSQWVVALYNYLLTWMQNIYFLLGLSIGLALQDHIRNGFVKIINGFLCLLVTLSSISPTPHSTNWDQIWFKTWEMPAFFGCRPLPSFHFTIASALHMQVLH